MTTPAATVPIARRWKCKRCGRDSFVRPCAHRCNGRYQYQVYIASWEVVRAEETASEKVSAVRVHGR